MDMGQLVRTLIEQGRRTENYSHAVYLALPLMGYEGPALEHIMEFIGPLECRWDVCDEASPDHNLFRVRFAEKSDATAFRKAFAEHAADGYADKALEFVGMEA
jgi:hypothetical protein